MRPGIGKTAYLCKKPNLRPEPVMKKTLAALLLLLLWLPTAARTQNTLRPQHAPAAEAACEIPYEQLAAAFRSVPDSIRTSVYWYWLSGNVSRGGVIKDLEAMKRAGINRAFIGNIGLGQLQTPWQSVELFTDAWWEIVRAALKRASELDIEIGMFNCPGWSQAGGPWIDDSEAMRYLTAVRARVEGGRKVRLTLRKPADDFQDVRVIAYPAPQGEELTAARTHVAASRPLEGTQRLLDGDRQQGVRFDGAPEVAFDFTADADFTLRSLTLWPAPVPIRAEAELQVCEPAGYRTLARFDIDRSNPSIEVGFDPYAPVAVSVEATRGRSFRLIVRNAGQGTGIAEVRLSSVPCVERWAEKSLAKMFQSPLPYWEEYQWRTQPEARDTTLAVDPQCVRDITASLDGDLLEWEAPAGEWIVLRTGMRPTGIRNSPAAPEGSGHEVDKMTPAYLEKHFDAFIGEVLRRIPAQERRTFRVVVADSYEKGGQNFSDTFLQDFRDRYGYDALPFLPVYSGTVVGSRERSDRFLWDMRRFAADRLAYAHIGGLREIAHRHGLTLWLENYGHWGFPGEFLQYGGQSDEVAGEFWSEGTLGDIENRAASSCAHIYGKRKVSAESFTAAGNDFARHPRVMKPRGDRFFAEGINNTLLHVYVSQPDDTQPGMNAWFGNEFNRNNTWFAQMDLFTDYLKRTNLLLQQGLNVADAAYFIGEDAPKMTGVTDPALPRGYQFDYINGEVLRERMSVRDGRWTLPHGTQYRILVLPRLETMRPELLARLEELVRQGGVLLGPAPQRSPSLEDYPAADGRVAALAARMWSSDERIIRYGEGMLLRDMSMEEALRLTDTPPDCLPGGDAPVHYGHRTDGRRQIYFLTNQSDRRIDFPCTFRTTGLAPEAWDPLSGSVRRLPDFTDDGRTTTLPLVLEPHQSLFVVFDRPARKPKRDAGENFPEPLSAEPLTGPWTLSFEAARRGPDPVRMQQPEDLSRSADPALRHYSGIVTYDTEFRLDRKPSGRLLLDTGEVGVMARVWINGRYAGGIWTAPYRVDITPFVRKGANTLRIEVATTWVNRLIGDSMLPADERATWTFNNPWRPDSPLQPSGLLHPVTLKQYAR